MTASASGPEDGTAPRPFARALSYFPAVRGRWWKGMACILPTSGLDILIVYLVSRLVDGIASGSLGVPQLATRAALIGLLVLVMGAAKFGMRWWITGASREFERRYRQDLFEHLLRLTPRDLAHVRTGDIMSRSVADIEAVRMLLGPAVMYNAQALVVVPASLAVMFALDPWLAGAMVVPFAGLALVIKVAARPTQHWSEVAQERLADLSTVAQESFSGIRVVKAFATEAVSGGVFRRMGQSLLQANLRLATLRGITSASIHGIKELGTLLVVGLGGWRAVQGHLTTGEMFFFLMALGRALWPLIAVGWMLGLYHRARAGALRLEALFALEPSVAEAPAALTPPRVQGALEVRGLTFAWDDVPVLKDISFAVPAGTTLGVTGRTGCGKSTLVQLLCRLVEPPPGTVLLDGHDVRALSLPFLRRAIGVVPQDTFLFSETIEDNIGFAGEVDGESVRRAARLAMLAGEIEAFSDGYHQMLGERGVTLSGGQRQRAAIARALAADPPLLILDDCLSAVDSVTEQAILRGLREDLEGRTAVVVSHRVAALSLADHILVLDEGRIVEQGSHAELVARGGLYAEIEERQRIEQEIEAL